MGRVHLSSTGLLQPGAVDIMGSANAVLFRAVPADAKSAAKAALPCWGTYGDDGMVSSEADSPLGSSSRLPLCDQRQVPEDVYEAWAPAEGEELGSASLWTGPRGIWGDAMVVAFGLNVSVCAALEVAHRLAMAATECDVTSAAWVPLVCAHAAVAAALAQGEPTAGEGSHFYCTASSAGSFALPSLAQESCCGDAVGS